MNVGQSVRKSIADWEIGELDAAMLHACNALDGTARKTFPTLGNKARFTRLLRERHWVFGPMGMAGINLEETRFPVRVLGPTTPDRKPDFADVIYGIHRCSHGHGDDLPDGFELIADAAGPARRTRLAFQRGSVRLSDRSIFGLLAVAVFHPVNVGQRVPDGYHFTFGGTHKLMINDWWGKEADFPAISALEPVPLVKMEFGDWMDVTK